MPCVVSQPISRMPSLHYLLASLAAHSTDPDCVLSHGVDRNRVYYVVNPDGNLPNTQAVFQQSFERFVTLSVTLLFTSLNSDCIIAFIVELDTLCTGNI